MVIMSKNPQTDSSREWFRLGCLFFAAILATLFRASAASPENPTSLKDFVRTLESSYRDVKTLRADFVQTHQWSGRTRVESGTVSFARGGLMRWEYRDPKEKLFLANRRKVFLYVPEDNRVTRSAVKSSEDIRVPFRLLLSRLNLGRVFERMEFADDALKLLRMLARIRHFQEQVAHLRIAEANPANFRLSV